MDSDEGEEARHPVPIEGLAMRMEMLLRLEEPTEETSETEDYLLSRDVTGDQE